MKLKNVINEKKRSVKATQQRPLKGKQVLINDVVFIFDEEDKEEDFTNLTTLQDVIKLDKKKPNLLLAISPPLYSTFKSTVTKNIEPYVEVGDIVVYKNIAFAPDKKIVPFTVSAVVIKSLGNMSVIIAEFESGGFALTTQLKRLE